MSDQVVAIINGQAGGVATDEARTELTGLLDAALPGLRILFTDERTDVTRTAREALEAGCRLVIAGGGDGTISSVATALAGSSAVLGVLPVGTLNHFAKDLGIPLALADAVTMLAAGQVTTVDVGEVNGRIFINNSGLGLYPGMVALRDGRQRKGMKKWPALAWATAKVLAAYPRLRIRVTIDGTDRVRRTPIIFVGNNEYAVEGFSVGTRQRLDGAQLCLYIPNHRSALGLLWFSLRAVFRLRRQHGEFDRFLCTGALIEAGKPNLTVSVDGEITRMAAPLRYRIRPAALRVLVPAPGS